MRPYKVSFIGTGNVGGQLMKYMSAKGFQIGDIYSRDNSKAQTYAEMTGGKAVEKLSEIHDEGLVVVAVPDDALPEVVQELHLENAILVHVSGSVSSSVLRSASKKYGILYPLQTITAGKEPDWQQVPLCIYSPQQEVQQELKGIAERLSSKIYIIDDKQRQHLHLAAVFANNFTNRILSISRELLEEQNISPELLFPLIEETFKKALKAELAAPQTGPAARGDKKTMEKHLSLLHDHPELKNIYAAISENITGHLKK